MKLIHAYNIIRSLPVKIFSTQDASILLGVSNKHGNQILVNLTNENLLLHLRRSLWALNETLDPFILPEYLTAPFISYISLQTALHFHGLIEQIPSNMYVVSSARTRIYKTTLGIFSIHHIQPTLCTGYIAIGDQQIKMATAEKALFDFFYFKAAKSKLFYSLPEVELPKNFNWHIIAHYAKQIANLSKRSMVQKLLDKYQQLV